MKKHRALLGVWGFVGGGEEAQSLPGVWGFVGGSIPEDSISSVYCVWWRLSTVFPRGRSSVFREAESLCTEEKKHRALPGELWLSGWGER